ncbi:MAG TPA: lipocalin family protein [Candidatus Cryptobacteroides pullicola]|nr:lipocalin family protein [Candidatus Cryptobacteroides pullicola]
MKKIIITLIVTAALIVGAAGCNKNKPDNIGTEMVGQWELTGAEFATRSITVGDEVLTVYIDFQEGGTFRLYQQLGEGRFAYFNGTWAVAGDVVSGRYSDNTPWASEYRVSVDGDTLTMTAESGAADVYVYSRCSIPSGI